ncbi:hypothetical protein BaRGS_00023779, partial [Batillaria attramentaria]
QEKNTYDRKMVPLWDVQRDNRDLICEPIHAFFTARDSPSVSRYWLSVIQDQP